MLALGQLGRVRLFLVGEGGEQASGFGLVVGEQQGAVAMLFAAVPQGMGNVVEVGVAVFEPLFQPLGQLAGHGAQCRFATGGEA